MLWLAVAAAAVVVIGLFALLARRTGSGAPTPAELEAAVLAATTDLERILPPSEWKRNPERDGPGIHRWLRTSVGHNEELVVSLSRFGRVKAAQFEARVDSELKRDDEVVLQAPALAGVDDVFLRGSHCSSAGCDAYLATVRRGRDILGVVHLPPSGVTLAREPFDELLAGIVAQLPAA